MNQQTKVADLITNLNKYAEGATLEAVYKMVRDEFILSLYEQGKSKGEIANTLRLEEYEIARILEDNEVVDDTKQPMLRRDMEITFAILNGKTPKDLAQQHGLSTSRINTIVSATCRHFYYLAHRKGTQGNLESPWKLGEILKQKEEWLALLQRYKVSLDSNPVRSVVNHQERNFAILEEMLTNYNAAAVGLKFDMSASNAKAIATRLCREMMEDLPAELAHKRRRNATLFDFAFDKADREFWKSRIPFLKQKKAGTTV